MAHEAERAGRCGARLMAARGRTERRSIERRSCAPWRRVPIDQWQRASEQGRRYAPHLLRVGCGNSGPEAAHSVSRGARRTRENESQGIMRERRASDTVHGKHTSCTSHRQRVRMESHHKLVAWCETKAAVVGFRVAVMEFTELLHMLPCVSVHEPGTFVYECLPVS
jgi:hypothetical protein